MEREENPHLKDILNTIRNGFSEKQLTSNELNIIYTYIDLFANKKLPEILMGGDIPPIKALNMIGEYTRSYGKNKSYDKYFEIDAIDAITIKEIIRPNTDKDLKITFVDVDGELSIVLHNENNSVFGLYNKKNSISVTDINNFRILKEKFEDKGTGLKLFLNTDLTNRLGVTSENTTTITINYQTHFSTINLNELKTIYLFPAIDTETVSDYKHRITLVMFFAYKNATAGTVFYDTFQICPPDGC
jgi:hypothetical protein